MMRFIPYRSRFTLRNAAAACALATLAAACGSVVPSDTARPQTVIERAALTQPPLPPTIVARTRNEIDDAAAAATDERLRTVAERNGARRYEGAQIPFFFESEIGRTYLRAAGGRALARGVPADQCPAFGVALNAPGDDVAAASALRECLAEIPVAKQPDCGCRLIAAGSILLAENEEFAYARAIHARVIDQKRGLEASLIVEEQPPRDGPIARGRLNALAHGARSVWLLGPTGPLGALDLLDGGAAQLRILEGPDDNMTVVRTYAGRWEAEGFRRGRLAKRVAVVDEDGGRMILMIGYEPIEFEARREELTAATDALFSADTRVSRQPKGGAVAR